MGGVIFCNLLGIDFLWQSFTIIASGRASSTCSGTMERSSTGLQVTRRPFRYLLISPQYTFIAGKLQYLMQKLLSGINFLMKGRGKILLSVVLHALHDFALSATPGGSRGEGMYKNDTLLYSSLYVLVVDKPAS